MAAGGVPKESLLWTLSLRIQQLEIKQKKQGCLGVDSSRLHIGHNTGKYMAIICNNTDYYNSNIIKLHNFWYHTCYKMNISSQKTIYRWTFLPKKESQTTIVARYTLRFDRLKNKHFQAPKRHLEAVPIHTFQRYTHIRQTKNITNRPSPTDPNNKTKNSIFITSPLWDFPMK